MSIQGVELHWSEAGSGKPLIVLHGLADSHHSWRAVTLALSKRYRVYSLDLPGCGLSERPDTSYDLDYQARLTAAWLARLGLEQFDLVGHSYGGGVALWLLLYRAPAVRRLALVAPGGLGVEVSPLLRLAAFFGHLERAGELLMAPATRLVVLLCGQGLSADVRRCICEANSHPGTARAFARTLRDVIDWRGQRRHLLQRIREVTELPPIALFWGDRDRVIPIRHGQALCATLENCSLWSLRGGGHFLHWQAPKQLAEALLGYLDAPVVQRSRLAACGALPPRRDPNQLGGLHTVGDAAADERVQTSYVLPARAWPTKR
jgi:pimeloyl-ACP methyl ester carboxylesterase